MTALWSTKPWVGKQDIEFVVETRDWVEMDFAWLSPVKKLKCHDNVTL